MRGDAARRCGRRLAAAAAAALCVAASPAAAQAPPARLQACAACHGSDGNSVRPGSPSLAAQPALFLENQLVMIREGLRDVPEMKEALQGVTDEEIVMLARHYASLPAKAPEAGADGARVRRGAALSQRGLCGTCHLPDYRGRDQIPRLAGQREDYLLASLRLFRSGVAPGRDTIMSASLVGLSDADLADLAHYLASYGR